MMKSTYGTGCFALLNTGRQPVISRNRLLTTIAYQLSGKRTYALEGSIFVAGAAVQWLRDGLGIISHAGETAEARRRRRSRPAGLSRAGLCRARGALLGCRGARRALRPDPRHGAEPSWPAPRSKSVCYQTRDLLEAMRGDWGGSGGRTVLRVDGGMVASDWTMQFLADILAAPVDRPKCSRRRRWAPPISPASRRALPGACGIRQKLETRTPVHADRWTKARGRANSPAGAMPWGGRCHGGCEGRLSPIIWWCGCRLVPWQGTGYRALRLSVGAPSLLRRNCWLAILYSSCTNARRHCPCAFDRLACGNSLISP